MRSTFIILVGILFLMPQSVMRMHLFGHSFHFGFITVLIIYVGFSVPLAKGIANVFVLSLLAESLTLVPHGYLVVPHLFLYLLINLIVDRIYSEAYLTKGVWVFIFSLFCQLLFTFVYGKPLTGNYQGAFWFTRIFQAAIDGFISVPIFILLDFGLSKWLVLTGRRRGQLTAADIYQAKSKQKKFF